VHPSGERLYWSWDGGGEPSEVQVPLLECVAAKLAACALLARHWPGVGSRDDAALALSGMLVRAGWHDDAVDHFVRHTALIAGDEEWRKRGKERRTREQLEAGKNVTGAPKLSTLLYDGESVVTTVREWLGLKQPVEQPNDDSGQRCSSVGDDTHTSDGHLKGWDGGVLLSLVKPECVQWLWGGYIPLGKITVADGDPGLGKTTLFAADLGARVSTGRSMPDGSPGIPGGAGVVIFTAEDDPPDTLQPRLAAAGGDLSKVVVVTTIQRPDPDSETGATIERLPTFADRDLIERKIAQVNAKLVIFDPFMAYLPEGVNSFRDQDIRSALAPLARLAQKTGAAFVLIRQLNKGNFANALYRGGGSIGIIGAARMGLLVVKYTDDENLHIFGTTKSNLGPPMPSWKYRIVASGSGAPVIQWEGQSERSAQEVLGLSGERGDTTSKLEAACNLLREILSDGPHTETIIVQQAQAAGISRATLRRAKKVLGVESDKAGIGKDGYWLWRWPDASKGAQDPDKDAHISDNEHLRQNTDSNGAQEAGSSKDAHSHGDEHLSEHDEHLSTGHVNGHSVDDRLARLAYLKDLAEIHDWRPFDPQPWITFSGEKDWRNWLEHSGPSNADVERAIEALEALEVAP
jgi:hypothetical protein